MGNGHALDVSCESGAGGGRGCTAVGDYGCLGQGDETAARRLRFREKIRRQRQALFVPVQCSDELVLSGILRERNDGDDAAVLRHVLQLEVRRLKTFAGALM